MPRTASENPGASPRSDVRLAGYAAAGSLLVVYRFAVVALVGLYGRLRSTEAHAYLRSRNRRVRTWTSERTKQGPTHTARPP